MDQQKEDEGALHALVLRMRDDLIPRARQLLENVEAGEVLSEGDIGFLKRVYRENMSNQALIMRNPDYQRLMFRFIDLYTEICDKALENEKVRHQ